MRLTTTAACLLLAATAHAQTADQDPCEALKQVKLPGVEVRQIVFTKAGADVGDLQSAPAFLGKEPAFCRVLLTGHPSEDSSIATEVWLPLAWNGRLRGQGNGGFAGFLDYPAMAAAVQQGFATDTGHRGGTPDFALHHPEKVKDFGWRAVHEMTVAAKAYAEKLYGKQPLHSYFASCSDGGREALMEAERFPADYDGILAGAPAWNWTGLVSAAVVKARQFTDPATAIPAGKIPAIAAAVREACDKLDGVADGVLNDPRTCHFDPARLQCTAGDGPDCLTAGQVATLRGI
jgi:feruloyl esterase